MPVMYVVAGPSGSGKTSAFPGSRFGCDFFNADDYAAHLNGGSYVGIPRSIRAIVGRSAKSSLKITSRRAGTSQPKQHCAVPASSVK